MSDEIIRSRRCNESVNTGHELFLSLRENGEQIFMGQQKENYHWLPEDTALYPIFLVCIKSQPSSGQEVESHQLGPNGNEKPGWGFEKQNLRKGDYRGI